MFDKSFNQICVKTINLILPKNGNSNTILWTQTALIMMPDYIYNLQIDLHIILNNKMTTKFIVLLILIGLVHLSYSSNCTADINCISCNNGTTCTQCVTNFQTYQGTCLQCNVSNCQTCQQADICSTCIATYTLSENVCYSCPISKCLKCTSDNNCSSCDISTGTYQPNANGDLCVICNVQNCTTCSVDNSCSICSPGYNLYPPTNITNQICVTCSIDNCDTCSANDFCEICNTGYSSLANGSCFKCFYPCATCFQNGTCQTCSTPTFVSTIDNSGNCYQDTIPQCANYNLQDNTKCSNCITGYGLNSSSGRCTYFCNYPCLTCQSNASACLSCNTGSYLSGSICQLCASGCAICTSAAVCSSTLTGFYLSNGEPKPCPSYCAECTSASKCTKLVNEKGQSIFHDKDGNSQLAICPTTCSTCSTSDPETCIKCLSGFALKQGVCVTCNSECESCSPINPSICLSCYMNTYLSGTKCVSCDSNCRTCAGSSQPAVCTSCRSNFYLSGTTCIQGCGSQCLQCSSATTCTKCQRGYTIFQDTDTSPTSMVCIQCKSGCKFCVKNQPSYCTECGEGSYLAGSKCVACSSNCKTCTANGCTGCYDNFYVTQSLTCSANCVLPCASCIVSQPTKCTSCIAGYSYSSTLNKCTPITSCDNTCSVCPFHYSLLNGKCLQCTNANCQKCNPSNPSVCYSCNQGFYLSGSTCVACPNNCGSCTGPDTCLSCLDGYTYTDDSQLKNGYTCKPCQGRCKNCGVTTKNCIDCQIGYVFDGWKCIRRFQFGFNVVLLTDISTFNKNYKRFLKALSTTVASSDLDSVTINSVESGSVIVTGKAESTADSGSTGATGQYNSLAAALAQNLYVANMKIAGSSLEVQNGSLGSQSSTTAIGLILGICIPVGILSIVGIILFVVRRRKNTTQKYDKDTDYQGYSSKESVSGKEIYNDNSLL